MVTTFKVNRLILQALVILLYHSSKFTATTLQQLLFSFNVEVDPDNGGICERNSGVDEESDGEPMLPKVLDGLRDAWLLSSSGAKIPPIQINARNNNYDSAVSFLRLRGLLFVFFGIRINSAGAFDAQNQRAYNNMLGNMINPLSFNKSAWILIPAKSNRRISSGRCSPNRPP